MAPVSRKHGIKGEDMIAQDKLVKAVGAGNVSRDAAALEAYAGDMSFVNPVRPDCVVKIKDAAAVSKLVNRGSLTARSVLTNVQDFVVTVERGLRKRGG